MAIAGMSDEGRLSAVKSTLEDMEALAARLRELIAKLPPHDLLGYIYAQRLMAEIRPVDPASADKAASAQPQRNLIDDTQLVLEYIHAVLASTPEPAEATFDEAACAEIMKCIAELKGVAMFHAVVSSAGTEDGAFGPDTADVEFRAKSNWVLLRGNRYQVLEGEFYRYVLAPHDAALRNAYGIGADDISAGFQDMADAVRTGHAIALAEMERQQKAAEDFPALDGEALEDIAARWRREQPEAVKAAVVAFEDLLRGGICNVSRHTRLPAILLSDLSFERGEEKDFYAEGPYAGTPFRSLPARRKPLIKLGDDFYAVDPCFARDAGYRALLYNLLRRHPEYRREFEDRQKAISEAAFFQILDAHLKGAKINQGVWYKDPRTHEWVENDTLIRIDDVLLLVEAKSGAAATIASPAVDFPRHVQAVRELVIKAYEQCKRFFDYLASAQEVPIFERKDGKYRECDRIRLSDYRVLLPIGLTVESFSPFSTMCKELPAISPLLGKHAFLSLSIDDLFVLKRFLPTIGELAHYFEVRQAVAGLKGSLLFDEFDHLGAYIANNRFDQVLADQMADGKADFVVWDGMSDVVDRHFANAAWETTAPPCQQYPDELVGLLRALDRARTRGWLAAESAIRNYGGDGRANLAATLSSLRSTLEVHQNRYFHLLGSPGLFVWLQRVGVPVNLQSAEKKASAVALAAKAADVVGVLAFADAARGYTRAERITVTIPTARTVGNVDVFEEAARIGAKPLRSVTSVPADVAKAKVLGRNDICWCGSGKKYKKCHGRH